jgi:hypothetical protein
MSFLITVADLPSWSGLERSVEKSLGARIASEWPTILPRSLAGTCSILSILGANRIQELLRVVANPVLEDDFDVLNVRNSL